MQFVVIVVAAIVIVVVAEAAFVQQLLGQHPREQARTIDVAAVGAATGSAAVCVASSTAFTVACVSSIAFVGFATASIVRVHM